MLSSLRWFLSFNGTSWSKATKFWLRVQEPYLLNLKAVALESSLCITKCQGCDLITA